MEFHMLQLTGIFGLISIIIGLFLTKKALRVKQYVLFMIGGILLTVYSIFIGDVIFSILQIVYILVSIYGIYKVKKEK